MSKVKQWWEENKTIKSQFKELKLYEKEELLEELQKMVDQEKEIPKGQTQAITVDNIMVYPEEDREL